MKETMKETMKGTLKETMKDTVKDTMKERIDQANLYLERMAAGRFPFSDRTADETSDLNDREVIRALFFVREVIKEMASEKKSSRQQVEHRSFPVECLEKFVYEGDKSIIPFVSQLKNLAGAHDVKGMSTKKITDWLKGEGCLRDEIDAVSGNKITVITKSGDEAGLYSEVRNTRFGQEYEVIMYSKKAQLWLVENMSEILGQIKN